MVGVSIEKMAFLMSAIDGDTGARKVPVSLEIRPSRGNLSLFQGGRAFGGREDAAAASSRRYLSRADSKSAVTLALTGGVVDGAPS